MLKRNQPPVTSRGHRLAVIGLVLFLLVTFGWVATRILEPAFQPRVVMTSGADNGIYRGFADHYAPILKRNGVVLDIRSSSGSLENYQRLTKPDSEYDIGFIQSGTTSPTGSDHLQTIAAVSYEPIWVFYRSDTVIDRLSQLRGKRVSVGVPGSGLLNVALVLLGDSGITRDNAELMDWNAGEAYQGLENGQLDAAFFIGRPDAPMQRALLNSGLKLMSFAQADALVQKFPSLSKVIFPRGAASVVDDRPKSDVTILAATALLVAKDTLHPAIAGLLLDAAKEVHGGEDYFAPIGTFPNLNTEEFPISNESIRYFKSGRPFLYRYLPFWLASFIERRLLILVPFMAVLVGLLQSLPRLVEARMKRRIVALYRELNDLEDEVLSNRQPGREQIKRWYAEIEDIDARACQIRLPRRYLRDVYALKQAIGGVRYRIVQLAT